MDTLRALFQFSLYIFVAAFQLLATQYFQFQRFHFHINIFKLDLQATLLRKCKNKYFQIFRKNVKSCATLNISRISRNCWNYLFSFIFNSNQNLFASLGELHKLLPETPGTSDLDKLIGDMDSFLEDTKDGLPASGKQKAPRFRSISVPM